MDDLTNNTNCIFIIYCSCWSMAVVYNLYNYHHHLLLAMTVGPGNILRIILILVYIKKGCWDEAGLADWNGVLSSTYFSFIHFSIDFNFRVLPSSLKEDGVGICSRPRVKFFFRIWILNFFFFCINSLTFST